MSKPTVRRWREGYVARGCIPTRAVRGEALTVFIIAEYTYWVIEHVVVSSAGSELHMPIPIPFVAVNFLERHGRRPVPIAFKYATAWRCRKLASQPRSEPRRLSGFARNTKEAVCRITQNMIGNAPNSWHVRIVQDDDPADREHFVNIKEINQRVVERVPAVYDGGLNFSARGKQPWQFDFRFCLVQVHEAVISGTRDISDPYPTPLRPLKRIDRDMPRLYSIGCECVANEERRNAVGHPDFKGLSRLHRAECAINQGAFFGAHAGMQKQRFVTVRD
jgi:hypothetical protein